jgi:hypothetical protein
VANKTFSIDDIRNSVEKKTGTTIKGTRTGAVVFTEFGARLLGLFPSLSDPNTLWVPEDIDQRIESNDWLSGGERLWIAPQRDYFFKNPLEFEGFHVSPNIDPGIYSQKGDLKYESAFSLSNYSKSEEYDGSVARREFTLIDDPYESCLDYAGVQIFDHLSVPSSNVDMCAWSIAMVNTCGSEMPGTVLFPVRIGASLVSYFDPVPSHRATVENGYARFLIDSQKAYKMAIRPEDIVWENPAKVIYIAPYPGGKRWFCLIKRSDDLPKNQDDCVDTPCGNPDGPKGATQAYNSCFDHGSLYGEIELQLNKGISDGDRTTSSATHELLGYTGTKDEILSLAQRVLAIEELPKVF